MIKEEAFLRRKKEINQSITNSGQAAHPPVDLLLSLRPQVYAAENQKTQLLGVLGMKEPTKRFRSGEGSADGRA
jgi:hypothetical protein